MTKTLAALALLGALALPAAAQTTSTTNQTTYTAAQVQTAQGLLDGLKTLQASRVDPTTGRLVVVGLSAVDRLTLLVRLREAGLPTSLVDYQTAAQVAGAAPTTPAPVPATPAPAVPATPATPAALTGPTTLPTTRPLLAIPHRAALAGPATVTAGTAATWSFTLSATGQQPIRLSHGACDVRFEVLDAAGAIVRPDPKDTICTLQIVVTDVGPGETAEVQKIRWDGRGAGGQALPAGRYTLRAVFSGAGVSSLPATLNVTLR